MIPVLIPIGGDELFPSWMDEVMRVNGAETPKGRKSFLYAVTGDSSYMDGFKKQRADYFEDIPVLCGAEDESAVFPSVPDIITKHTSLTALLPFMDRGTQARRFEYCLHRRNEKASVVKGDFSQIPVKICPLCLKEDMEKYGRPVMHVKHSLYVNACYKHGCRLVDPSEIEAEPIFATEAEIKTAVFMSDLYDSPAVTYYEATRDALKESIKYAGYALESACREAENAGYIKEGTDINRLLGQNAPKSKATGGAFAGLLTWTFRTADNFKNHLPEWNPDYTGNDFELISQKGVLAKYRCRKCGAEFYMHPVAAKYGTPCPRCRRNMAEEEIYQSYADHVDDGAYDVMRDDLGKIHIIHRACGEDKTDSFNRIVWTHCKCKTCLKKETRNKYIGRRNRNNSGKIMEITDYQKGKIQVKFENGETKWKSYDSFKNGSIASSEDKRLKADRIGEETVNRKGLKMRITAYRNANDIDIAFEDGTIVYQRQYSSFKNGAIPYPDYLKTQREGMRKTNFQGIGMELISYRTANDIDVRFDTGDMAAHAAFRQFEGGKLTCPSVKAENPERIGEENVNGMGHRMKIIGYPDSKHMDVLFDNGYVAHNIKYGNFKKGEVRCREPEKNHDNDTGTDRG